MEVKIKQGEKMLDATIEMVDGVMVVSPKEKFEPKDGDIVYVKTNHENIIIYKEQTNKLGRYVNYFNKQYLYIDTCDFCGSYANIIEIRPATEEEKKELFDKLAEEGYEWKPDTKELVKLKWKPKVGEIFYTIAGNTCSNNIFFVESYKWVDDSRDNNLYYRRIVFKTKDECQEFCNRLNDAINSVKP